MDYGNPIDNRITFEDWGRNAMYCRHSVFKVHDIPPAAYFQVIPGAPTGRASSEGGVVPSGRVGDVCSGGLWDEAADEPIAYPFVAGDCGMCYIPNYNVESAYGSDYHGPLARDRGCGCGCGRSGPIGGNATCKGRWGMSSGGTDGRRRPAQQDPARCSLGCSFSE